MICKLKYGGFIIIASIIIAINLFAANGKQSKTSKTQINQLEQINAIEKDLLVLNMNANEIDAQLSKVNDSIDFLSEVLTYENRKSDKIRKAYTELAGKFYIKNKISSTFDDDAIPPKDEVILRWIESNASKQVKEINKLVNSTDQVVKLLGDKTTRQVQLVEKRNTARKNSNDQSKKKQSILKQTKADKTEIEKYISSRSNSTELISDMIGRSELSSKSGNLIIKSGQFLWPSKSKTVLSDFGGINYSGFIIDLPNQGIDIAASAGSGVIASGAGTIEEIYWYPGYGSFIIIYHGNNIRTIYSNLSRLNVRKGQNVSKGEIIGENGDSIAGELLHFEIWVGNTRLNPIDYLKK